MQSARFRKLVTKLQWFYLVFINFFYLPVAYTMVPTCSLGVLQSDAVAFEPIFPEWKRESLLSFHMTTYTKIFLKFEQKFWGDWQVSFFFWLQVTRDCNLNIIMQVCAVCQ
jgi:hypothetical protein